MQISLSGVTQSDRAKLRGGTAPRVLMLAHRVPYPVDKGDRIRTFNALRWLAARATVDLACLADEPVTARTREVLSKLCANVAIVPVDRRRQMVQGLSELALGGSASVGAFRSRELRATVRRWAERWRYSAALASASSLCPYLKDRALRGVPSVVDFVDLDSQKWAEYAARAAGIRRLVYKLEARRLRWVERDALRWARGVMLVSEAEADDCRRACGEGPIHAVTNGVDLEQFSLGDLVDEPRCLFVGALDYLPNIDGITWFCERIWPAVRSAHPAARLWLVGRRPTDAVLRLGAISGVEVVGQVPAVQPYLANARVVVAPLRIARGVQNKVLEALAVGKATVASREALTGLSLVPGRDAIRAETESEWVSAVNRLLGDLELCGRIGAAGRAYVRAHHSWDECLRPLGRLVGVGIDAEAPLERGPMGARIAAAATA